jgi:hypothetical protein
MITTESENMTDLELIATLSFTSENGLLRATFPNGAGYYEIEGSTLRCFEICSDGSYVCETKTLS